jgi:capsular polysaccharide biosynthesis protein
MISPYHRDLLSDGVDHSDFGREIADFALTAKHCPIRRTKYDQVSSSFDPSIVIPPSARGARTYGRCDAKLSRALSGFVHTTLFLPDHAALIEVDGEQILLHESIWHTHLFFSDYFRNDRSTEWKWRTVYGGDVTQTFPQPVINCYHRFSYQYFHWFVDVLPRVWLALQGGYKPSDVLWFLGPLTQPFQRPSLDLFGIRSEQICEVPSDAIVAFSQAVNAGFSFHESLGTLRPSFTSGQYYAGWSGDYFAEIRDRAYAALNLSCTAADKKLFIDRRNSTHRKIVNEDQVLTEIQNAGFEMIDPGAMAFADQVRTFAQARVILAPHGAGLTNALWAPPGAIVAEFMPDGLNDVGYRFLAPMSGHQHVVLFCKAFPHGLGLPYADIEVDVQDLKDVIKNL